MTFFVQCGQLSTAALAVKIVIVVHIPLLVFCSLFIWLSLYTKEDIFEETKIIVLLGCSEKNFSLRLAKLLHSC